MIHWNGESFMASFFLYFSFLDSIIFTMIMVKHLWQFLSLSSAFSILSMIDLNPLCQVLTFIFSFAFFDFRYDPVELEILHVKFYLSLSLSLSLSLAFSSLSLFYCQ